MGLYIRFLKRFFAAVDRSHNCAGGFTGAAPALQLSREMGQSSKKKVRYDTAIGCNLLLLGNWYTKGDPATLLEVC